MQAVFPWRQGTPCGDVIASVKFSQPERLRSDELTQERGFACTGNTEEQHPSELGLAFWKGKQLVTEVEGCPRRRVTPADALKSREGGLELRVAGEQNRSSSVARCMRREGPTHCDPHLWQSSSFCGCRTTFRHPTARRNVLNTTVLAYTV
jgi:hypothetical protein